MPRRAHSIVALALALALAVGLAVPAASARKLGVPPRCADDAPKVYRLAIPVEGEIATGRFAVPEGPARGLVVIGHGYGHTSASWEHHMRAMADRGLIAVAMDYRGLIVLPDDNGDRLPSSRGLPVMDGAEDLIAAARLFDSRCAPSTITLFAVSGGVAQSGIALALVGERAIRAADGSPLFDDWIDIEGLANLTETYLEARAIAPANAFAQQFVEDIHRETGGPIESRPQAYVDRTVVARMDDVEASGVEGIVAIHGVDDGLVLHNQSRELTTLARALGIPTEMMTVGLRDEDSERETTLSGYAGSQVDPNYTSPLAGHASEKSTTHIVMETALERLWQLYDGRVPANRECAVNGRVPARVVCTP